MILLYNTLTRSVEPFTPLHPPAVTMYVCGPTVYDDPHIGHARSAYVFDLLRRYLEYRKFQVRFVRNVTDVDDKIIAKARQELGRGDLKATCQEVADRYLNSYHKVLDRLGIAKPTIEPKATDHVIPDPKNVEATKKIDASMTGFISELIAKNMAYPAGGDVYFPVRKFQDYGKLSNRSLDELKAGARVEPGEHKEDPLDFALWKAAKSDEPSWNSPWGPGRPGWHIECSVMSTAYLGDAFDIHGGGLDLIFPHHENEIAQAQALDKPFAKYWVHNGLLTVDGEKMSKSVKNIITVDEAIKESWGGDQSLKVDALKVFFLGTHYRSPIDYTATNIKASGRRFQNWFHGFLFSIDEEILSEKSDTPPPELEELRSDFLTALDDDMNTPRALAVLDKISNHIRSLKVDTVTLEHGREIQSNRLAWYGQLLRELTEILGISSLSNYQPETLVKDRLTPAQKQKIRIREEARKSGDFKTADKIRKELFSEGIVLEDTPKGTEWRSKK